MAPAFPWPMPCGRSRQVPDVLGNLNSCESTSRSEPSAPRTAAENRVGLQLAAKGIGG